MLTVTKTMVSALRNGEFSWGNASAASATTMIGRVIHTDRHRAGIDARSLGLTAVDHRDSTSLRMLRLYRSLCQGS